MNDYFNDFQASLFILSNEMISQWTSAGLTSDMQPFKWDAHADTTNLPSTDLIGPMELSLTSDDSLQNASVMIAVSTVNDENLDRLDQMIGDLYARLAPDQNILLKRASDATVTGNIKVKNGTQLMPVLNTDVRAVRAVAVSLAADSVLRP
jgi:hypothetical protein